MTGDDAGPEIVETSAETAANERADPARARAATATGAVGDRGRRGGDRIVGDTVRTIDGLA